MGGTFIQSSLTKEFPSLRNISALVPILHHDWQEEIMGGMTLVQMRDGFQSAASGAPVMYTPLSQPPQELSKQEVMVAQNGVEL